MNTEHPNISVLKQFNPTDLASSARVLAKNVIFHYFNPMLPELEGDYSGLDGFKDFFARINELTQGTFKINPISVTAHGNELVVVHSKNTMTLKGEQKEIDVVVVWRIVEGHIREVWDIPSVFTKG